MKHLYFLEQSSPRNQCLFPVPSFHAVLFNWVVKNSPSLENAAHHVVLWLHCETATDHTKTFLVTFVGATTFYLKLEMICHLFSYTPNNVFTIAPVLSGLYCF